MKSKGIAIVWAITILLGSMLISGPAPEVVAKEEGQAQKLCPILGKEVLKSEYIDHEGKRVYFCCSECKTAFSKDPGKYIKEMEAKGIVLDKGVCKKAVRDATHEKCTK